MTQEPRTKQQILDEMERQVMLIAGEVVMAKIGYMPNMTLIEDTLGEVITGILELKKIEGIPSTLRKEEHPS